MESIFVGVSPTHHYSFLVFHSVFTAGLLGAVFVTGAVWLAPLLGFATFQLAVVAGQLISGMFMWKK
jgi:uncharacterized membrane protein YdcZ (DUF606 family)